MLSLSGFLSYFFLCCLLCSSVGGLESKYSYKLLILWPDVFLYGRRHSLVNVQDRDIPISKKKNEVAVTMRKATSL